MNSEVMEIRQSINNIIDKIENVKFLKRVYALAEYLYIHK